MVGRMGETKNGTAHATGNGVSVALLMDRLVNSTTPSDVEESLRLMTKAANESASDAETMATSSDCTTALLSLIGACTMSGSNSSSSSSSPIMMVDEGRTLACELVQTMLTTHSRTQIAKQLLQATPSNESQSGGLVHALVDGVGDATHGSSYGRILALSVLQTLFSSSSSAVTTQTQLLSAPDGINRLVDLLKLHENAEDVMRNEAVLLLTDMARSSSSLARLIMFSEGLEQSMAIALAEGGLTSGHVVVKDCLVLLRELCANDDMGCDLLLNSRTCLDGMSSMLDLRRGTDFLHPSPTTAPPNNMDHDDEDDLDAMIKGDSSNPKGPSSKQNKPKAVVVPYLTEKEEALLHVILDIVSVAIVGTDEEGLDGEDSNNNKGIDKKRQSRQTAVLSHRSLSGLLMEMALYAHPPVGTPYPSAVPSPKLQCRALSIMSRLAHHATPQAKDEILDGGGHRLERLMYFICTGGLESSLTLTTHKDSKAFFNTPLEAKLSIGAHALNVLRCALGKDRASLMVLHTLAPPPPPLDNDDNDATTTRPEDVPVPQKLVNTLAENLNSYIHNDTSSSSLCIRICGAAGALGVLLTSDGAGETTREMLLRVVPHVPTTSTPKMESSSSSLQEREGWTLLDYILAFMEHVVSASLPSSDPPQIMEEEQSLVLVSLLRLLAEWVSEAPVVLKAMFQSPASVSLGLLFHSNVSNVSTLTGLLMGLTMEQLLDSSSSSSSDGVETRDREPLSFGGWSRSSIMDMISKRGASKYTSTLERFKSKLSNDHHSLPWSNCTMEQEQFSQWYGICVSTVRRRVVSELTGFSSSSPQENDDDDDDNVGSTKDGRSVKALHKLLASQTVEMETLRESLIKAEGEAASNGRQVKLWKRRVESAPSQLDDMLSEYVKKTQELEESNQSLKEEMEAQRVQFQTHLAEKDDAITQVQTECRQIEDRERAVSSERDTIQEEMQALSAAYSSLESEYHRVSETSGTQQTGEECGQEQQQEQTTSEALTESSEDTKLSSENSQLRADALAADEWMTMASERMQEIAAENASLKQEIAELRSAPLASPATSSPIVSNVTATDSRVTVLEEKILDLKEKLSSSTASLSEFKSTCADLEERLEKADEWMAMAVERMQDMGQENLSLKEEFANLQSAQQASANTVPPPISNEAPDDSRIPELEGQIEKLSSSVASLSEFKSTCADLEERLEKADEWMATAVERIQDMGQENISLKQEFANLQSAQQASASTVPPPISNEAPDDSRIPELEGQIVDLKNKLSKSTASLLESESACVQMEERVESLHTDMDAAHQEIASLNERLTEALASVQDAAAQPSALLTQLRAERDAILKAKNEELQKIEEKIKPMCDSYEKDIKSKEKELFALRSTVQSLEKEIMTVRNNMTAKLNMKEQEIERQGAKVEHDIASKQNELLVLRDTVDSLQKEIMTVRTDMASKHSMKEKEIEKRDEIILVLEGKSEALIAREKDTLAKKKKLEEEFEELLTANDAAQDWIKNSVEQHGLLSAKLAQLTQQNNNLTSEIEIMRSRPIIQRTPDRTNIVSASKRADEAIATIQDLQQCLDELTVARDEALATIEATKKQLETKEAEINALEKTSQESASKSTQEVEQVKAEISQRESALKQLNIDMESMKNQHEFELDRLNAELLTTNEEVGRVKRELEAAQAEMTTLQEEEVVELQSQVAIRTTECEELRLSKDQIQEELSSLTEERDKFAETIEDLKVRLTDFNTWASTAQQRIAELEAVQEGTTEEERELTERLMALEKEKEELASQLAETTQSSKDDVQNLVNQVKELCSTVDMKDTENANLTGHSKSLEQTVKILEMENAELKGETNKGVLALQQELDEAHIQTTSLMGHKKSLEVAVKTLEKEIEELQAEEKQEGEEVSVLRQELEESRIQTASLMGHKKSLEQAVERFEKEVVNLKSEMEKEDSQVQTLQRELEESRVQTTSLMGHNKSLDQTVKTLEHEARELNVVKSNSEEELSAIQMELEYIRLQSEEVVNNWKERAEHLEENAKELEDQLEQQESAAQAAIAKWEDRCTSLQSEISELSRSVEEKSTALENSKQEYILIQTRVAEMESTIESLETELENELEDRDEAVNSAEEEIESLSKEINEMKNQSEEVVNQWSERTQELESTVSELESTIEEQRLAANEAIAQWESRCNTLIEQVSELEALEAGGWQERVASLERQLVEFSNSNDDLRAAYEALRAETIEVSETKDNVSTQLATLQGAHDMLMKESSGMKVELERLRSSHTELADLLSAENAKLQNETDTRMNLEMELANERDGKMNAETRLVEESEAATKSRMSLAKTLEDLKVEKENEISSLKSEVKQKADQTSKEKLDIESRSRKLHSELEASKTRISLLEKDFSEANELINALQEELADASDALQSRLTDEISVRATEMATQALRREMHEVRSHYETEKDIVINEQRAREAAEEEVRSLKHDLALIVSASTEYDFHIDGRIRQLAAKSLEDIHKKQRRDMDELKNALDRSMEELSAARKREQDAEDRASTLRLQISVVEHELLAAKSDLASLTGAMQEMRQSESEARSALTYRISGLEDDRATLTRSHSEQLDELKMELSRVTMEKERLQHFLSEFEKANAALVYSTSIENEERRMSPGSELVQLRLEKTKLISAASEASVKTERRIRAAVAEHASSNRTDFILEKELRQSAENMVADLQAEIESLRSKITQAHKEQPTATNEGDRDKSDPDENINAKVEHLSHELEIVKSANQALKIKLRKLELDAKASNTKLVEKCRQAEAKARELEREGHFEASVAAEISRLRAESARHGMNVPRKGYQNGDPNNGCELVVKDMNTKPTAEDAWDYIMELKSAIKDERLRYVDLYGEHEYLLGLLAQQNLERATLQDALTKLGGPDAVDSAVQKAEKDSIHQFGRYVPLR